MYDSNSTRTKIIISICFGTMAVLSFLVMALLGWTVFVSSITQKPFDWVLPLLGVTVAVSLIVILDTLVRQLDNEKYEHKDIELPYYSNEER